MGRKLGIIIALFFVIPGLMFTASCTKKPMVKAGTGLGPDKEARTQGSQVTRRTADDELARQRELEERRRTEREQSLEQDRLAKERMRRTGMEEFTNEQVYFAYNSSALTPRARDILNRKAEWLRNNPNVSAIIEGHCDDRGTNEYNLALGEKRAESVKTYIIRLGIPGSRLTTISYGEERPVAFGSNESAWAKNRRAQFVIE